MSNQTNNSEGRNEQKLEPFSQLAKMNATFLKSDVHMNEKKNEKMKNLIIVLGRKKIRKTLWNCVSLNVCI